MIFACRNPHTPAPLFSRTDGLDMKVSTRQKQGATRHNRAGAKGDNSASSAPETPRAPPTRSRLPLKQGPVSRYGAATSQSRFAAATFRVCVGTTAWCQGKTSLFARHVSISRTSCRGLYRQGFPTGFSLDKILPRAQILLQVTGWNRDALHRENPLTEPCGSPTFPIGS
jgi:hypothetical protein